MKRVLIIGSNGMLAFDLKAILSVDYEIQSTDSKELDITNLHQVKKRLSTFLPDIVVNCAAYTAVDKAESDGKATNYLVNSMGVSFLASTCHEMAIQFITISTDYVFDGDKSNGYIPTDSCNPCNAYGMAKYLGEQLAQEYHPDSIVIRTSWLYGGKEHKNFVQTMQYLGEHKDHITVIDDQWGLPTYTVDLCNYIKHCIDNIDSYRGRILHASNSGDPITRFTFAKTIMEIDGHNCIVQSCSTQEYPTDAKRPTYSVLLSDDKKYIFPNWRDSLEKFLNQ